MKNRLEEGVANIIANPAYDGRQVMIVQPSDVLRVIKQYEVKRWVYVNVIPRRTLADRQRRRQPLKPIEADRFWRLVAVLAYAEDAFGCHTKACSWLNREVGRFGGQSPLDACATEFGFLDVLDQLNKMEHGLVA